VDVFIKSKEFHLPGKKKLREGGTAFEVIVVDVAESPVERPQKNGVNTIAGRRNVTHRSHS